MAFPPPFFFSLLFFLSMIYGNKMSQMTAITIPTAWKLITKGKNGTPPPTSRKLKKKEKSSSHVLFKIATNGKATLTKTNLKPKFI